MTDVQSEAQERIYDALAYDHDASCITVCMGLGIEQVRAAFGVSPGSRAVPYLELVDEGTSGAAFFDFGQFSVTVEDNGGVGTQPKTLELLSSSGRAGSLYWNINLLTRLTLAEHGQILFRDEALDLDPPVDHPVLAAVFEGLSFDGPSAWRGAS